MKWHSRSWLDVAALLLAAVLISGGIVFGFQTFSHFEQLAVSHSDQALLLDSIRITAFYFMIFGSMVVAGIGILLVLFMKLLQRSVRAQREAEALRSKTEALEALMEKKRQLAHHQRLETIGTLTSSIAHEFNNLLTPIMGYSMLILEKLPPEEEELYDNLLEVYNASKKAKVIISRLSDLSRKNTETTFREASTDDLIRRTLEVAAPAKPEQVEIKLDLNCWEQRIRANEIQLSQLFLNLILNSFQAMETSGGTLTICTTFDDASVEIKIADTGCGIPEENRKRIFEPFFTTKEAGKGTGLGLAIAAQVVEDHNGTIGVTSTPGEGTVFCIRLPRTRDGEGTGKEDHS